MSSSDISLSARIFVFVVYACLGAAFLAGTGVLIHEFQDLDWLDFVTTDSHLFLFFPTLGIVALVAFYLPSCALADLYWRHIRYGKLRFAVGMLVIAALSYFIALGLLQSPKRSMWELSPATLTADQGAPANCVSTGTCDRLPGLLALRNMRRVSQTHFGMAEFVRDCQHDELLELTPSQASRRFCFASTPLSQKPELKTDDECCRAQALMSEMVSNEFANPEQRSLTAKVHAWILPLRIFFLLVLLAISILLVTRYKAMHQHYHSAMTRIEIGVIVGTLAVLFFPLMSQAFVQSAEVLYGLAGRGTFSRISPVLSLAFGAWALLMVFFFYRRRDKELEAFAKMASAIAGAIAVLKYSVVTAVFVRVLGSGASFYTVNALVILSIAAIIVVLWPQSLMRARDPGGDVERADQQA